MKIEGSAALVTGANRGLGAAIASALLDSGAKVYGAARDPGSITNDRLVPVRLDVTNDDDVARAARACHDVSIVVNNAGILRSSASLAPGAIDAARAEMETNFFGSMRMARAFAPVLGCGVAWTAAATTSWVISYPRRRSARTGPGNLRGPRSRPAPC